MNQSAVLRMILVPLWVLSLAACGRSTSHQYAMSSGGSGTSVANQKPVAATRIDAVELESAKPSRFCSLDSVSGEEPAGEFTVNAADPASFRGWAVDGNKASPPTMTLLLKGAQIYGLSAPTGQARPDVAKALSSAAAQSAGYMFKADLKQVPAGTYQATIWVKTSAGNTLCDTGKKIVVNH